jgi:hypothetical protein
VESVVPLFAPGPVGRERRNLRRLVEVVPPIEDAAAARLRDRSDVDKPANGERDDQSLALMDPRVALRLVERRQAWSVTLSGFPDGRALLRIAGELATKVAIVVAQVRPGGSRSDGWVHRGAPARP